MGRCSLIQYSPEGRYGSGRQSRAVEHLWTRDTDRPLGGRGPPGSRPSGRPRHGRRPRDRAPAGMRATNNITTSMAGRHRLKVLERAAWRAVAGAAAGRRLPARGRGCGSRSGDERSRVIVLAVTVVSVDLSQRGRGRCDAVFRGESTAGSAGLKAHGFRQAGLEKWRRACRRPPTTSSIGNLICISALST